MQSDTNGPNSDDNSVQTAIPSHGYYADSVFRQSQNHAVAGFPLPCTLGEALMNFTCAQMFSPNEFWNAQPGRDIIKDFSNGTLYPQISSTRDIQGVSLPGVYPLECQKSAAPGSSSVANPAFESTNYGLPFDASTRWDFNRTAIPSELVQRVDANELVVTGQDILNPNNRFNNELSLSLATSKPCVVPGTSIQEQCSDMSSSGMASHSLHKGDHTSCSSNSLSLNFNSNEAVPFSPMLSGSKYLPAVQEILAEIACHALENFDQMSYSASVIDNAVNDSISSGCHRLGFQNKLLQEREVETKKKHLMSLFQLVDEQYSQCLDEIHTVVSAFHAVTELDPNLHARFALSTISLMYKNLRERISRHILALGAHLREGETRKHNSFEASFAQKQWALQQQLRKRDHHLWKPQRGLPERSVSVLRAWMFQNFLHPYPKDAEKHLLAMKSGLTRSQVSNWFINARVRLWKPMIEEMYAEMNRRKARGSDAENNSYSRRNDSGFEHIRYTMN